MEYNSENKPDHYSFNKRMRANSKTKSRYKRVLNVYNTILENEDSDSDYWHCGGDDLIMYEVLKFEHFDWTAIEADLINWTSDQLLIFANALVRGDNQKLSDRIISKRSYLFVYILTIANDITDLLDDLEFITIGEIKPLDMLLTIKEKTGPLPSDPSVKYYYSYDRIEKFHQLINNEIEKASR